MKASPYEAGVVAGDDLFAGSSASVYKSHELPVSQ
jgi:hypothetical protein